MDEKDLSQVGVQPLDMMRDGFRNITLDAHRKHPVEEMQTNGVRRHEESKVKRDAFLYGPGLAMKTQVERQMASTIRRLPGMKSSMVHLEMLMGLDDKILIKDYLGDDLPEDKTTSQTQHDLLDKERK
ncbi:unnamed protein product [Vitrella brassicaformis CCMP3155]|uniref:Proteasome maturation factor UMP1 n=1 Tax=Vitrella brassicaformis (strain CCMP3155) TaxID=1169540 RepID=A0A0G4EAT9_VITBC|nr:unnamed protein product [Vitrella brassicaformis CCMP3155]|mmetsp:Transcript_52219/g.131238  ORF Transcript_52219/g.131238 Transcript_52219/m.131238 type:complete len:128 (-) Transcript_52219:209-592(-)|eukprot:CEL93023.1 unnamed protein product [Vitrella brassicaformis CCMP3155]